MKKIAFVFIGLFILSLFAVAPTVMAQEERPVFRRGMWGGGPATLDPHNAWDSASNDVIEQVLEGLVTYDLYDPELTIIPQLATDTGTWNAEATELTFNLRQGVTFHDGSKFNATAVKHSFDRLNHLIDTGESILGELYEPLAQMYPDKPLVINETVVVSEYVVKFILNYPYVAFVPLLCYTGSFIVHWDVPYDTVYELNATYAIGTGPYVLTLFTEDEYDFVAYENYYRPQPEIQEMHWIMFADMTAEAQAFLAGDIDQPSTTDPNFLSQYEAATETIFVAPKMSGTSVYYFGLSNLHINKTWRQAISYATDYEYLIQYIMDNQVTRMTSVIPLGIMYHDPTVVPASFNLDKARWILSAAGLSRGLTNRSADILWNNIAETDPLATFNFTYNAGNNRRGDMGLMLKNNLALIGIKLEVFALEWATYLDYINYHQENLQVYNIGWGADYNDPSNFINPLFSNTSTSNGAKVNDAWLQQAMMDALVLTDPADRRAKYNEIQHYIVEDLMPWCFLYVPYSKSAWSVYMTNVNRNAMGKVYYYPRYWYHVEETTTPAGFIPGYSLVALVGAAAITVGVLLYKRRR